MSSLKTNKQLSSVLAQQERKAGISLALIYAFRMLGLFMILPVFALYAAHLKGATPLLMGVALGIYGLTQAILQIPFGMLSDKIGRKPVIIFGLVLFAIGSIIAANAQTIEGIIAGRAIQGSGAIAAALMALAADLSREEHRTKMMALIGISIGMSFAISMVLGPLVNQWIGLSGIFYMTAVLAILGIAILLLWVPNPVATPFHHDTELETKSLGSVLKNAQLLRLDFGILSLHFVLMCVFLVIPILLQNNLNINLNQHWKIYLPIFIVSIIIMVPFIIIAEKKHAMKPIFIGAICSLIIAIVLLLSSQLLSIILIALLLFFTGFNLLEATLPSLIAKTAKANQKGTAMGVYTSSQFFGAFLGGLVGGYANQQGGATAVFATVFGVLVLWLFIAISMKKPSQLSSYLLKVKNVTAAQLLAINGVVEVAIQPITEDNTAIAYLKVKKTILDEEKLLTLSVEN